MARNRTRKTHVDGVVIQPGESSSITFHAEVLSPGKYQVNRFRMFARLAEGGEAGAVSGQENAILIPFDMRSMVDVRWA
jgi:hypothetical protein